MQGMFDASFYLIKVLGEHGYDIPQNLSYILFVAVCGYE